MSGLWLEDGLHLNISDEAAEKIAREIDENGYALFGNSKVRAVLPTRRSKKATPLPKKVLRRLKEE